MKAASFDTLGIQKSSRTAHSPERIAAMRESRSPERARQISLRMSVDDHRQLKELAEQNGVDVTSYLLGKALDRPFEPTRRSGPNRPGALKLPLEVQELRKTG